MELAKRTHPCGELQTKHIGEEVVLTGWVQRCRDHGGLIFIDLRDRTGIVQVVFDPADSKEAHKLAARARSEYVLAVKGIVTRRPTGTENPNLKTGEIEVRASALSILNPAKTPPFTVEDDVKVDEELRLRYRYIDLRRPIMRDKIIMRHKTVKAIRDFLDFRGFLEIETPILIKSTPEGARDFLVPSRLEAGKFYALPQSPQLLKQVLMVAGIEKYFQIARCFRDEDPRADRQFEFTQIDIEQSFVKPEDIFQLMEDLLTYIFEQVRGVKLETPFPRLTYEETISRFGTDRPDLRFGLELKDLTHLLANSEFGIFKESISSGGIVAGMNVEGCAHFSRKQINQLTSSIKTYGAKGLVSIAITDEGLKSPINVTKFLTQNEIDGLLKQLNAKTGDLLILIADQKLTALEALGQLRIELAKQLNLLNPNQFKFLWIYDFPLLYYNKETGTYEPMHHPFTAPQDQDIPLLDTEPLKVKSKHYDLVVNGVELGGGSIRIHQRPLQEKILKLLGYSQKEAQARFGFLLEALEYGAPPHGGIAPGLDRLLMVLSGDENIREVMAFPKTQSGLCPLTQAPTEVPPEQLKEINIKTIQPKKK